MKWYLKCLFLFSNLKKLYKFNYWDKFMRGNMRFFVIIRKRNLSVLFLLISFFFGGEGVNRNLKYNVFENIFIYFKNVVYVILKYIRVFVCKVIVFIF